MLEKTLFSVGSHDFRARHILVIAILASSFTISAAIRAQPAAYGFSLHEFDPFFNYRATEFLVENGLDAYLNWHDDLSWYPEGRDISFTSQFMQHGTAATLYGIFGAGLDLEDFVIILPLVLGALTCIVVFGLVRVIAGTTAGLFASLFFAISVPVILRGTIGWFKAEPIGLFYGTIGIYLFLSGITCGNKKQGIARMIGAGVVLAMGLSAWGGIQFFIIPLGLFFMILPFIRRDHLYLLWNIPIFSAVFLISLLPFERIGAKFVFGLGGGSIMISVIVMVACIVIYRLSKDGKGARNSIVLILGTLVIASIILGVNSQTEYLDLPSFRYLNAINPLLTTTNPLVDSVAEHFTLTTNTSFYFLSTFMIFAGLGVWFILSKREKLDSFGVPLRTDMIAFVLVLAFAGVYISSAFTRLVLFSSIATVIMAAIGLTILSSLILSHKKSHIAIKSVFVATVIVLFIVPLTVPANGNWIDTIDSAAVLYTGGTTFKIPTDDWPNTLSWIRTETPTDSIILSWWDYGYWIQTLGERTTLVDNLTRSTSAIQNVAKIFYSDPNDAWIKLDKDGIDYVLIYISAQHVAESIDKSYYILTGGGDEIKKIWIARIAELNEAEYVYPDQTTPLEKFDNTLLGQMIPFSHVRYINLVTGLQSVSWQPDFVSLVEKDVKLPVDGVDPFRLVYSSPSFDRDVEGIISGVFIYELNNDYVPIIIPTQSELDTIIPFLDNSFDSTTLVPDLDSN